MKHILIISFTDLARDPRVDRQIRLLSTKWRVAAAGMAPPQVAGVDYFPISRAPRPLPVKALEALRLGLRQYERYYWADSRVQQGFAALSGLDFDAIVANDVATLPLALALARNRPVLLDAHEYSPREYEERFVWRLLFQPYNEYLCARYLPAVAGMLTVCDGIANEYRARYGVSPRVLTNAPYRADLTPSTTRADTIRMIHHGGAQPGRKIEAMIEMMGLLDDRFHLDLMLVPASTRYFDRLTRLAAAQPRVRIVAPVAMQALPQRLNEYDVGVYLLPANSFNNQHALPNKFFEFIQGRLAVAIGPSPEMAALVRRYGCGVVAREFTPRALAASLSALDARQIDEYKQRSHAAAAELCFESNAATLLGMLDQLMGAAGPPRQPASVGLPA